MRKGKRKDATVVSSAVEGKKKKTKRKGWREELSTCGKKHLLDHALSKDEGKKVHPDSIVKTQRRRADTARLERRMGGRANKERRQQFCCGRAHGKKVKGHLNAGPWKKARIKGGKHDQEKKGKRQAPRGSRQRKKGKKMQ